MRDATDLGLTGIATLFMVLSFGCYRSATGRDLMDDRCPRYSITGTLANGAVTFVATPCNAIRASSAPLRKLCATRYARHSKIRANRPSKHQTSRLATNRGVLPSHPVHREPNIEVTITSKRP